MKILYMFRSVAVWGGIERILVDKMNYLVEKYGMDVYLLTTDQGSHSIPYALHANIHHKDLNICFYRRYSLSGLKRLISYRKMLRKYEVLLNEQLKIIKPDVIVCTTTDYINTIAKLKGSVPLVVESHSICVRSIEDGRFWLQRKIYRRRFLHALSKVDILVSLTEGDARQWREYHHDVRVIPNFVHQHDGFTSSQKSKKVIFVGRFDYQKRVQDAIQMWNLVRKQYPNWRLEIYGEGEMFQDVKALAATVGNVVIHQPTKDIFQAYCDSSALIMTSLFEPFGLVLIEAMACGLPVVAFDCPYGPADIVTDGENGFLIKDRNIEQFANAVCKLIKSEDLRKRMGQSAIASSKSYRAEAIIPKWIDLFENIVRDNN